MTVPLPSVPTAFETTGEREVPAGWEIALRFWWAFTWRLFLVSGTMGFGFSQLFNRFGGQSEWGDSLMVVVSSALFLLLEIWLMRRLLGKRFGAYRVAILKSGREG